MPRIQFLDCVNRHASPVSVGTTIRPNGQTFLLSWPQWGCERPSDPGGSQGFTALDNVQVLIGGNRGEAVHR